MIAVTRDRRRLHVERHGSGRPVVVCEAGIGASRNSWGADDLLDVLADLDTGPAVLVGHSWGGPIVRTAAARAPGRVAGLVLVDQTDENCESFFTAPQERRAGLAGSVAS